MTSAWPKIRASRPALIALCACFVTASVPSVIAFENPGTQTVSGLDAAPTGLTASAWAEIRETRERNRHAIETDGAQHQAQNPRQQWQTEFDGRGFLVQPKGKPWRWGLEVQSYGFGSEMNRVADRANASSVGSRLEYNWDENFQEWFVNDRQGLEHGFTVKSRPEQASGPLRVTLNVRGDLSPQVEVGGRDVRFRDALGSTTVTYRGLKVFDADNRLLPATFEIIEFVEDCDSTIAQGAVSTFAGPSLPTRTLVVSVDDRGARYPVTIDPLAQQAYVKSSNSDAGDNFGIAIAVSGDTVVVGANEEDSAATAVNGDQSSNQAAGAGAVYVFVRNGAEWVQQAYLKASNAEAGDAFGTAVGISGDTIVVGAYRENGSLTGSNPNPSDNAAVDAGAAYVFVRQGSTWTQQAYLKASNTGADDLFGGAVAISGDTIVIGAPLEDSSSVGVNGVQQDERANGAGAAYIFVRQGDIWSQQAYLKASNTGAGDLFGASVAISGGTVLVGAYTEASNATGVNGNQNNNSAINSGAAYVFVRDGSTWSQQAYLKASNTGQSDFFGNAVSISGNTAIVGAVGEDSNGMGAGGSPSDNSLGESGAAYVFTRSGSTWSQQAYLKSPRPGSADYFGYAVAISGDAILVGSNLEDSSATGVQGNMDDNAALNSGAVYLYKRTGSTWSFNTYFKASNTGTNDFFGAAVGLADGIIAIGAPYEDSGAGGIVFDGDDDQAPDSGSAYFWADLATIPTNLFDPTYLDSEFSARIQTEAGKTYHLEYQPGLDQGPWTEASRVTGNGTVKVLTDPTPPGAEGVYRARIE